MLEDDLLVEAKHLGIIAVDLHPDPVHVGRSEDLQPGEVAEAAVAGQPGQRLVDAEVMRVPVDEDDGRPFRERFNYYDHNRPARRLRILEVDVDEENDRAYVRIAIDNFYQGGLFDSGTSTYRRTIPLVREDGEWKIDTEDLFY